MTPSLTYLALFFGFALEGTSLPVPAELLCLVSGHYLSSGLMSFWGSVMAAATGNVTGGLLAYLAGYRVSEGLRRSSRLAPALGVNSRGRERAEDWFRRYGALTTFCARWVGFIRPAALLGAGALRLSLSTYAFFAFLGSFTYCLFWQYLGWKCAPWVRQAVAGHLVEGTLALAASLALGIVVLRWLGRE